MHSFTYFRAFQLTVNASNDGKSRNGVHTSVQADGVKLKNFKQDNFAQHLI